MLVVVVVVMLLIVVSVLMVVASVVLVVVVGADLGGAGEKPVLVDLLLPRRFGAEGAA